MKFTVEQVRRTFDECNGSIRATALKLGCKRDTVRTYKAKWEAEEKPRLRLKADGSFEVISGNLPGADTALHPREKIAFQDTISDLRKQLRDTLRDDLTAEKVRKAIFGIAEVSANPPDWISGEDIHSTSPGIPSVIISDIHHGEVVSLAEMGGANEFNMAISRQRLKRLTDRVVSLCFDHMVNPDYPGIIVNLGGDMLSGDIHDELSKTNEAAVSPALVDLLDVLVWVIGTFADKFGRVFVPCVHGNHGRMTRKPQAKQSVYTNFDWLLYVMLERHFANDSRVQFYIPETGDAHYKVFGHRYFLTHGDAMGVKGGDGIVGALGPIMRGELKTRASEAQVGREYDTALMGHWHQLLWLPRAIVNGSVKGYDEFARRFMRTSYQPPQQALWFTHKDYGITAHWPVFLEDGPTAVDDEWVSWPKKRTLPMTPFISHS